MSGEPAGAPGAEAPPTPTTEPPRSGSAVPPPGWPATPVPPPPRVQAAPLFPESWRGPTTPPSRPALLAVAAAALIFPVAVPEGPSGLGWLVTAFVVAAATLAVAWYTRRSVPPLPAALTGSGWTLAAVGMAGVATVRDAEWLVVLCLLAAAAAASLAVAGRSIRGVGFGACAVAVAALRGLTWLGRGLREAGRSADRRALRTVASVLVGLALLAVFVPLLTSADAAFARILDGVAPRLDGSSLTRWALLFALGASGMAGACFLLAAPPTPGDPAPARASRLRTLEWALPVAFLVGLFALFVGVQLATLFGSDAYVRATTGLTYAEYARSGFWQLLAVTVLTLGVIVLGSRWAPSITPSERVWKRGLLATLAVLTLVIVASALSRMWLYQQAYGFTVLRLLVLTCELWLGVGFLIVLTGVLRLRTVGLGRGMVAAGVVALLGLAVLDPEGFVAGQNVERFAATGELDVAYLGGLSTDAVPALAQLPEPQRTCALTRIAIGHAAPADDWRSWNVARSAAEPTLAELRSAPSRSFCGIDSYSR